MVLSRTGGRWEIPKHRTEARNLKVVAGIKIVEVTFQEQFDGFRAKDKVRMYLTDYDDLKRSCVRHSAEIIGTSSGDLVRDNVNYRFSHLIVKKPVGQEKIEYMSARVGSMSPKNLCKPKRPPLPRPKEEEAPASKRAAEENAAQKNGEPKRKKRKYVRRQRLAEESE